MAAIFRRRAFAALYLLGSASTLALEVVWARWMAAVLGGAVEATSCVLAAFMGGLGAGAFVAARTGDRLRRPARAFALAQVAGGLAAGIPHAVFLLQGPAAFMAGLISVSASAFPLGLLFPLAARVRSADSTGRGSRPGLLYAQDTAGAVGGALCAGLLLVPALGLAPTLVLAASVKLLIAAGAVILYRRESRPGEDLPEGSPSAAVAADGPLAGVLLLAGVQGFALLGAESLWSRVLAFVLYRGSTTYALAAMLAVVLAFTSLGAMVAGRGTRSFATAVGRVRRFSLLGGAALLFSLALLLVAGPVPEAGALGPLAALVTVLACAPASFFSGAVFASACQAASARGPARGAGRVLAVNSLAAVGGALVAPLVLVPFIGLGPALALLGLLPVAASLAVSPAGEARRRWPIAAAGVAAAALLSLAGPRWVRHLGPAVFYREGPDVSVAVIAEPDGSRRLFIDGIAVAGTDLIMSTDQKTLAHLPVLLHPHPGSVLTVGFGSGGTSHSLLLHPGLEVDCVEISPTVIRAAPYLQEANQGLPGLPHPRYRLHVQDARRFLRESDRRFDLVVNDCTDLAYRGEASLYTLDFFIQIRRRLAPGGMAAAWIPLRGERPHQVQQTVMRTFCEAFAEVSLWVFDSHPTHFGILVGSNAPLAVDLARIERALAVPGVAADLRLVGLDDPLRLASSRQLDDRSIRRISKGAALHTDGRPLVEFLAAGESGDDASAYDFLQDAGSAPPAPVENVGGLARLGLGGRITARAWLLYGHRAYLVGDAGVARVSYLHALRASPDDPAVLTLLGIPARRIEQLAKRTLQPEMFPRALNELGVVRLYQGRYLQALELFASATVTKRNDHATMLGTGLAWLGEGDCGEAAPWLFEALSLGVARPIAERAVSGLIVARLPGPLCRAVWALTFAGL